MIEQQEKLGDHDRRLDSVEERGDRIVVAVSWADKHGDRHRWAHVLKLKNGKIVDIQDHANPTLAVAATRLRAVFGQSPLGG